MNCANAKPLLEEYFEGLISDRRAGAIAEHLVTCAACAAELRQIEKVASALAAVPHAAVSDELLRAISAHAAALPEPRQARITAGWRMVGVIASIFIICFGVVSYVAPLLIPGKLTAGIALLGRLTEASVFVRDWFAVAPEVLRAFWFVLGRMWGWLALIARAVAPMLGIYLAAEIAALAAIVYILQNRGRRTPARLTVLI